MSPRVAQVLWALGQRFGAAAPLRAELAVYRTPLGPGHSQRARGRGNRVSYGREVGITNVWTMLEDYRGQLWVGTWGSGIIRFDGESFTALTTNDGLVGDRIYSLCEDRDHHRWIGTADGITVLVGDSMRTLTVDDGLVGAKVYAIHQDRHGDMWFGTRAGLSRYDGAGFTSYTTP